MAAGRGSRFGGLKQIAPVGPSGEALFDYAVYDALRCGFDDVVFVVSETSVEAVEAHVEQGCGRQVRVRYALQKADGRAKPWGTGHAVLSACGELDGSFGVVNADDFYGPGSIRVLGEQLSRHLDHVLVAFRLGDSLSTNGGVSRGVCTVGEGFLTAITELHDVAVVDGAVRCREGVPLTGEEVISTNLWGFRPSFCRVLSDGFDRFLADHRTDDDAEFLIGDAVAALAGYGEERVAVVASPERFLGVTYLADVAGVAAELAGLVDAGQYPSPLWR